MALARNSRTADRPGPAHSSPFRSKSESTREHAAVQMLNKRRSEIAALEKALVGLAPGAKRNALRTRLRATKNNMQSWLDYIEEGSYREPRAVIVP